MITSSAAPLLPWSQDACAHLSERADPAMAALVRRAGPVTRPLTRDYCARLVRAIVGQQISGKAAAAIYGRLVERAGWPLTPVALQALADDEVRACGLSQNKLLAVRALAQ